MFSKSLRKFVAVAISILLFASSAIAGPIPPLQKPSARELVAALALAATKSAPEAISHQDLSPFELLVCPLPAGLMNGTSVIGISEESGGKAYEAFSTFLPVLLGKSTELLQNDLCEALVWSVFETDKEVYEFCDDPDNLIFSKAAAKSLGQIAKGYQAGKSGFALAALGVSAYGSVKLSQALSPLPLSHGIALTSLAIAYEQFSKPEAMETLLGTVASDYYVAFDHWAGRPFIYPTAKRGCRYALEKEIQQRFIGKAVQEQIAAFIKSHSFVSQRSAETLAKGSSIGAAKVATGMLAASVISVSEMTLDAFSDEPEFPTLMERIQKYIKDVGISAGTNLVIAFALPTSLVAGKVRRVFFTIFVGGILHWMVYAPKI